MSESPHRHAGERLYRTLLRCYPADFRELYGEMMVDFYRARLTSERARGRGLACLAMQGRMYLDVVVHGIAERVAPLRSRDASPRRRDGHHRTENREMISNLHQDLLFALRGMRRAPGFAATVLVTLALGIGVNVAIFSVVHGVLLRPLPFADPDRVIQLSNADSPSTLSEPEIVDLERDGRSFERIGAYAYADGNVTGGIEAERVRIARVSAGFFHTLAPALHLGRGFTRDEDRPGAPDVVVISYGMWQRRFGMDSATLGRTILMNGTPRVIVGVLPAGFDYPAAAVSVWTPLRLDQESLVTRNNHYLRVVARLAPGVSVAAADREMRSLRDRWAVDHPESYKRSDPLQVDVRPIRDRVVGGAQPYLVALLGAVGFVLLVACVNVANLLLARAEVRQKEMMIRTALGATRARIAAQLSLESALLTVVGGMLGMAVAWPVLRIIVATASDSIPRLSAIRVDWEVLGFAAAICVLTGVLFALAPILRGAGVSPLGILNSGARTAAYAGGRSARRVRAALVVSEVSLAVMMLAGAGLFLRSLAHLQRTDLGFATSGVLTARLSLPRPAYTGEKGATLIATLVDRTRAMPGVTSAAAMAWTPIVDGGGNWGVVAEGARATAPGDTPTAAPQQVTPRFFSTMSIRLLRGREFSSSDRAQSEPVVIVSESLARRLWATDDVIGRKRRMSTDGWPWMIVVGVVGDTRAEGVREPAPPVMYFPHQQAGTTAYFTSLSMTLLVRFSGSAAPLVPAIKQAVRELDANIPVSEVRTMDDVVGSSIARHRFTTLLLAGLAAFALLLAAIGIYGVVAYSITQRRYEFGVRMALGAGRARVLGLVVREGLGVTVAGLAIGIAGVMVLGRLLGSMLVNVGAVDVTTLAAVSALLLVIALLALVVPARRATAIDPSEALRRG